MRPLLSTVSPAKINLHLRVGAVRPDGFHPLHTWMVTVGLFDTLNFQPGIATVAESGGDDSRERFVDRDGLNLSIRSDDPAVPTGPENLIARAAAVLAAAASGSLLPLEVVAEKLIPMGGGLGGGSSNAAATLRALNTLWDLQLPAERLAEMAARLGSDVPFFLSPPSAICTGRGEIVRPIAPPACRWAVLILPGIAMPTAAVYRRLDALRAEQSASRPAGALRQTEFDDSAADSVVETDADGPPQWTGLSAAELLPRLVNDLEAPAFDLCPDLAALRQSAEAVAGRPVRMSGSGSTLFTLFDTKNGAENRAENRAENGAELVGQELARRLAVRVVTVRVAP